MGMSASQMRYIMISGKKSDIEFQGQQINQQRTTLATESSSLNSSLLNMTVPTPPSTEDYTKVTYTFPVGGTTGTVKSLVYNSSTTDDNHQAGHYTLKYSVEQTGSVPQYSHNAIVRAVTETDPETSTKTITGYQIYKGGQWQNLKKVSDETDEEAKVYDQDCIKRMTTGTEEVSGIDTLSGLTIDNFYKFEVEGTMRYIPTTALSKASAEGETEDVPAYYVNNNATYSKMIEKYNCQNAKYSSSGRLESIEDDLGHEIDFTVATEVDDDAYTNAYNEYLYKKDEYEQNINKINSQLEVIQAQDKKLELKLQDLDTQQSAIQTEMDAVKKVIDKNIETTFKTFA